MQLGSASTLGFVIARHLYQEALKSAGKQNLVLEDMEVDDSGNVASVATKEELVTSSVEKLGLIQFYSVFMLQCYVRGFWRQTKMSMEEYPLIKLFAISLIISPANCDCIRKIGAWKVFSSYTFPRSKTGISDKYARNSKQKLPAKRRFDLPVSLSRTIP